MNKPKAINTPMPALIWLHGGGYVMGKPELPERKSSIALAGSHIWGNHAGRKTYFHDFDMFNPQLPIIQAFWQSQIAALRKYLLN